RLDVQQWLEETPQLALSLLDAVTARLEDTEARLSELVGTTVGQRLGEYLAGVADGVEGVPFDLPISKRDLAQLLGTTPETISRRLRALSDEGLLRVGPGRRMVVMDIAGMLRA
ncbi:MAG: Crp/Fnr family transcriptional regulator, partial [Micrococcales bacterium]|nr:Crp/Fnr family transcriptional regulator [Micrococcales bacterium]